MPCDGKNPNCDRRRELLAQLKCLVSSMDRKKPCEWDEPPCPAPTCCPVPCNDPDPSYCCPVKQCKSFDFRTGIIYKCECIKRNGLQDRCMMWDCMGRPECTTKLYPVCGPGRAALLKLTDLGDAEVALRKFHSADRARETALAAYCRLVCNDNCQNNQKLCNTSEVTCETTDPSISSSPPCILSCPEPCPSPCPMPCYPPPCSLPCLPVCPPSCPPLCPSACFSPPCAPPLCFPSPCFSVYCSPPPPCSISNYADCCSTPCCVPFATCPPNAGCLSPPICSTPVSPFPLVCCPTC